MLYLCIFLNVETVSSAKVPRPTFAALSAAHKGKVLCQMALAGSLAMVSVGRYCTIKPVELLNYW